MAMGFIRVTSIGPRRWIARAFLTGLRATRDGSSTRGWAGASGSSRGPTSTRIAATIAGFPERRHADLWSGVGLACAYAGGRARTGHRDPCARWPVRISPTSPRVWPSPPRRAQRAGNPAAHTELACRIICGMPAEDAARLTDRALERSAGRRRAPRLRSLAPTHPGELDQGGRDDHEHAGRTLPPPRGAPGWPWRSSLVLYALSRQPRLVGHRAGPTGRRFRFVAPSAAGAARATCRGPSGRCIPA